MTEQNRREFKRICVYCAISKGGRPEYEQAARDLGYELADRGIGLVYGGSKLGLMGVLAKSVLDRGGEVIGVMWKDVVEVQQPHESLTKLHVLETRHERKGLMEELADAFIALPGAFGTYEELFETLTLYEIGSFDKPCGLLNLFHYYDPLLQMFDRAVEERFMRPGNREFVVARDSVRGLLDALAEYPHRHEMHESHYERKAG